MTGVADDNYFMNSTQDGKDNRIGWKVGKANWAGLGGNGGVGSNAKIGALKAVHQFCRVGAHTMLAAFAVILQDVPPYVTVQGYPAKPHGTNSEGLRRRGFSADDILTIRRAYKTLYRENLPLEEARAKIAEDAAKAPALAPLADFLAAQGRGIVR